MKNILLYTIAVLLFIGGIASCNKIDEIDRINHGQAMRLTVKDTLIQVSASASEAQNIVVITGDVKSWTAVSNDSWITVSKGVTNEYGITEEVVILSIAENTYYSRYGSVTLSLEGTTVTRTFRVLQAAALDDPFVRIGENAQINIGATTTDTTLNIETNQSEWVVSTTADWITPIKEGNQLKLSLQENEGLTSRTGVVTVVAGTAPYTATATLTVQQAKPDNESEITVNGIEMVLVKAGTYYRGAQSANPAGRNYYSAAAANQGPVHQVTISRDFYIGKYELTQAQYEAIMGNNPSSTKGADHPVEMVGYNDAVEFTIKLSQATGLQFRLPTEAEWEYAARGGSASQEFIYAGSNTATDVAYHFTTGGPERDAAVTVPVGSFMPNSLGIYDMSGNVYEWCLDKLDAYTAEAKTDPVGTAGNRILRGGSWYHNQASAAVSYRGSNTDDFIRAYLGFRIIYIPEE